MAYFRRRGCKCEDKKKCKCGAKWSFTVDIGVDDYGKRIQKTRSGFDSRKDAELACAELMTDIERGEYSGNKDTVEGFMKDLFENQIKLSVSAPTYETQKAIAENHIYPVLGKVKITKLSPMQVQKLYSDSIEKKKLSPGVASNIGIVLGKALRSAHQWGVVTKNVVSSVSKPAKQTKPMQVWTQEEVNKFLKITKESRFHVVYLLALTTGMRIGEILALKWQYVDFKNNALSVQLTTAYANNALFLKEPKTAQSRRLITLPPLMVSYLKQYKLKYPTNELDLVVTGINVPIVHRSEVTRYFRNEVKEAGLPKLRFHDLRHTHATLLLQMGEHPKVVQERLGHTSIATTMNTYSHVLPTMQKQVADKLNDSFVF